MPRAPSEPDRCPQAVAKAFPLPAALWASLSSVHHKLLGAGTNDPQDHGHEVPIGRIPGLFVPLPVLSSLSSSSSARSLMCVRVCVCPCIRESKCLCVREYVQVLSETRRVCWMPQSWQYKKLKTAGLGCWDALQKQFIL